MRSNQSRIIRNRLWHSVRAHFYRILFRYIDPIEIFKNWWVYPLNGQARRIHNVSLISNWLRPRYVIETGTYLGSSTWFFLGIPSVTRVFSIESNRNFHKASQERLLHDYGTNLELLLGDSKTVFWETINDLDRDVTILCYLDAHWEGDIPTTLELEALDIWGGAWVAIIDDFKVDNSNQNGYGYDKYFDKEVDISTIPPKLRIQTFIPDESAVNETGARRGTAYVVSNRAKAAFPRSFLTDLRVRPLVP